jgi:hypothetical protein
MENDKPKKIFTFYKHIRCGILHQAETTGGYVIIRKGELFVKRENSIAINANEFVKMMEGCVKEYTDALITNECNSLLWKNAAKKIGHICDNCEIIRS